MTTYISYSNKIDNNTIELKLNNGTIDIVPVIKIESREKALELLETFTKDALKRANALESLERFIPKSRYEYMRNYEIEDELEIITNTHGYRIDERCPFNGFSWFS